MAPGRGLPPAVAPFCPPPCPSGRLAPAPRVSSLSPHASGCLFFSPLPTRWLRPHPPFLLSPVPGASHLAHRGFSGSRVAVSRAWLVGLPSALTSLIPSASEGLKGLRETVCGEVSPCPGSSWKGPDREVFIIVGGLVTGDSPGVQDLCSETASVYLQSLCGILVTIVTPAWNSDCMPAASQALDMHHFLQSFRTDSGVGTIPVDRHRQYVGKARELARGPSRRWLRPI